MCGGGDRGEVGRWGGGSRKASGAEGRGERGGCVCVCVCVRGGGGGALARVESRPVISLLFKDNSYAICKSESRAKHVTC